MTVLITLSTAGTSTTVFNLFSNINYGTPLATGITKAQLLAGYFLLAVPDNATIIRIVATGVCDNQVDLAISGLTTTSTTSTSTTTTTTAVPLALKLIFDDIANADILVGDASSVTDWNTFFDLPTYGNPFTSVIVIGNEVQLFGGSEIILKNYLFGDNINLLKIIDNAGCIINIENDVFISNYELNEIYFPEVITGGDYSFDGCYQILEFIFPKLIEIGEMFIGNEFQNTAITSNISMPSLMAMGQYNFWEIKNLINLYIPLCTNLGGSVGYNQLFENIESQNITLTIPSALMTCNSGAPDGDIQYLQANNTVTIITTTSTTTTVAPTTTTTTTPLVDCVQEGLLYNWEAATYNGIGGATIAPVGWHLPTNTEINTLKTYLSNNAYDLIDATKWPDYEDPESCTNSLNFNVWNNRRRTHLGVFETSYSVYFWGADSFTDLYGWLVGRVLEIYGCCGDMYNTAMLIKEGHTIRLIKNDSVNEETMTDYDGNIYSTVTIGSQVWMGQNLMVTHYNDGTPIPYVANDATWETIGSGAFCVYNGNWNNVGCNITAPPILAITFDNISSADTLVGDSSDVTDWNTFFDLPTNGNVFTSVSVIGNEVNLIGGSNITIKDNLFNSDVIGLIILQVNDIGGCVTTLGSSCFYYQPNMTSISFPNVVNNLSVGEDYGPFAYAYGLTYANLPSLVNVGNYLFYECQTLESAILPYGSITEFGIGMFSSCLITDAYVDQFVNLEIINDYALQSCTGLISPPFSSVTSIGYYSMYGCTNLTTINLPLATTIGDYSLYNASSLTTISLPSCVALGTTVLENGIFANLMGQTITLTVPAALMTCNSGNPDGDIQNLQANNTVTIITTTVVPSVEFSNNDCIILYGPLVGGSYTDNCSGTITVTGASAQFRAYAYLNQDGGNVNTSFDVIGVSPGSYAEQNPNSGTDYGNYITLTPGTYDYSLSISMFNGIGSEGGIEWIQ